MNQAVHRLNSNGTGGPVNGVQAGVELVPIPGTVFAPLSRHPPAGGVLPLFHLMALAFKKHYIGSAVTIDALWNISTNRNSKKKKIKCK